MLKEYILSDCRRFNHGDAVIGENCNILHVMTIGISNTGKKRVPINRNYVFIGPNAGIFGNITTGNNVAIGANPVIPVNIANGKTVVPAKMKVVDKDVSSYYIHNCFN